MSYPEAPWKLQGYAVQTLHLVNVDRVRSLVPIELDIISVCPGKTVASVYLSYYGSGSELEYSELIIVPAIASCQGKFGGWVSHIYVDQVDSMAGGRDIWGLPKELADFDWGEQRVTVSQGNKKLCTLNYGQPGFAWTQRLAASSFSAMGADLLIFPADFKSRLSLISSQLEVPLGSPFTEIDFGQPFLTTHYENLDLQIGAPEVVGQRKVAA